MESILRKIVETRRRRLSEERNLISIETIERAASQRKPPLDFASVFHDSGINIIAEIKKASPSKGILRPNFDPAALGMAYQKGGAKALSVLTEQDFFMGNLSALQQVREAVSIPILRKDFIIDSYQILESRAAGADSFLLIAALMKEDQLNALISEGRKRGMEPLVEVHTVAELYMALAAGARIIGINNRDLGTFSVDLNVTIQLIKHVPPDCKVISESGIRTRDQILQLKAAGVAGFLIGETIVVSKDPEAKIRELIHD